MDPDLHLLTDYLILTSRDLFTIIFIMISFIKIGGGVSQEGPLFPGSMNFTEKTTSCQETQMEQGGKDNVFKYRYGSF
jgi:hypothetical protein